MLKVGDRVMIKKVREDDREIIDGMRGTITCIGTSIFLVRVDGLSYIIHPYKENVIPLSNACPMNPGETK